MSNDPSNPVTAAERYAIAATSGDLRLLEERRTDADVLLAAGLAAAGSPRKILALAIYRYGVTGDQSGLWQIVEECDGWLAGHLSRKGNRPMPKQPRRALIVAVLQWYAHPTCDFCGGTGVLAEEGTAGRLTNRCTACHGSGKKSLEREVPHSHIKPAQWLADQIQQHAAIIHADMAKLLSQKIGTPT